MARLIWAEPILQDLEQIADYIALEDPLAAERLVQRVVAQAELLEQFSTCARFPTIYRTRDTSTL